MTLHGRPFRAFLTAVAAVCCLTALGLGLFTQVHLRVVADAFEDRSVSYVQAFASSALLWKEDPATLEAAARLLLGGSAVFVQVSVDGRLIVDVRSTIVADIRLPPASYTALERTLPTDAAYLDIAVALDGSSVTPSDYARMGILLASVHAEAWNTAWIVAASGLGFVLLVSTLLAWALLTPARGKAGVTVTNDTPTSQTVIAGPLHIDFDTRRVLVHGKMVRFTPKQFALLSLLAQRPGTVFSEREILATVWPDSAYADSKDIKQYVYLIRKRLNAAAPGAKGLIETVPGYGYRVLSSADDLSLTEH